MIVVSDRVSAQVRCELALGIVAEPGLTPLPKRLPSVLARAEMFRAEVASETERPRPWLQGEGIQGLGIGLKVTKGQETDELALRVYVERKEPESRLEHVVPKAVSLPDLDDVTTDVIESGRFEPELFRERARPLLPGCGLAHGAVTVGTLGALVSRPGEAPMLLSNAHVLANWGNAVAGDAILQPGPLDGGLPGQDRIGEFVEAVPYQYTPDGFPNTVDAAIASVDPGVPVDAALRLRGGPPVGVSKRLRRGQQVQKVGRTSDFTTGIVQDVNFRVQLQYPGGRIGFRDQVLCTRFTAGGDSGSLVLSSTGRAVGLHFAGSPSASVFNRIGLVLDSFGVDLVTGGA